MKAWGKFLMISLLVFAATTLFYTMNHTSFVTAVQIEDASVPGRT